MRMIVPSIWIALSLTGLAAWAGDEGKLVSLADSPAAVQKAINVQVGGGKMGEIERANQDGETVYEVDFTSPAGADGDFTVAEDGTLLSVGVALADTPAAVQKTVQAQLHGWRITGINKNVADYEVSYDVEASKNEMRRDFNVDDQGNLSSVGMTLAETPEPVKTAITGRIGGGTVVSIDENLDPDGNSFDVEASARTGGRLTFSLSADGQVLSEGVALDQVPGPVRRTIQEKLGDGKVLEIDKSLSERKAGVLPYQVHGRKGGKEFDFSVGPRGKFLGMDE